MNNEVTKEMVTELKENWESESDYIDSVLAQTYEMESIVRSDYQSVKETLDQAKSIDWFFLDDSGKDLYFKTLAELNTMIARLEDRLETVLTARSILLELHDNTDNWIELTTALQNLV